MSIQPLSWVKLGLVSSEERFMKTVSGSFTPYYKPLIPAMNRLREVVFPGDRQWRQEDEKLYTRMREILREESEGLR